MRIAADICVYTNTNFTIEAFENGELMSVAPLACCAGIRASDSPHSQS